MVVLEKQKIAVYVLCKVDGGMLAEYSSAPPVHGGTRAAEAKEEMDMKWGGFNREGERKMKKLLGGKALYVLMTIAAAGLLMSEVLKWRPG